VKLSTINYQLSTKRGFTLVELLVVIAIIGILAAVVMIAINPLEMMKKGRDATRFSDIENVRKSIDIVIAQDPLQFPATGTRNSTQAGARTCSSGWVGMDLCVYLSTFPLDPKNNATFQYQITSNGTNYTIRAKPESEINFSKAVNDGGEFNTCTSGVSGGGAACWYEVGTNLFLFP